jgi:hypothetical protein
MPAVAVHISVLSGSFLRTEVHERSSVVIHVPGAQSIRALAVADAAGKPVLVWGTARGLFLWQGGKTTNLAAGSVTAVRLARVRSRLTLVAVLGGQVVRASAPGWRVSAPIGRSDGRVLSIEGGSELTALWSDGDRLELLAAARRPVTLAKNGSGVLGRLDHGRLAVAYTGLIHGRYSVHVDTIAGGRLHSETTATGAPCADPIALGTSGAETKVYLADRCWPHFDRGGRLMKPYDAFLPVNQLERSGKRWQLTSMEPGAWAAEPSGDNSTLLYIGSSYRGAARQVSYVPLVAS